MAKISYVVASVLLASMTVFAGIITGCSGAEEQPAVADSTQQSLEGPKESHSCALRTQDGNKTQTAQSFRQELDSKGIRVNDDPNDPNAHTITSQSCDCCQTFYDDCYNFCASEGGYITYFECQNACGLCGRDSAYSDSYCACGRP